jgi:hypothetical protein
MKKLKPPSTVYVLVSPTGVATFVTETKFYAVRESKRFGDTGEIVVPYVPAAAYDKIFAELVKWKRLACKR